MYRLRRFLGSVSKLALVGLSPTAGQKLYEDFTQAKTKDDRTTSVDSGAEQALRSEDLPCVGRDEAVGADECPRGRERCRQETPWEAGAVAALMALLMGMRVSEITDRIVRNLDDDGRLLWSTDAKTHAGIRRLQVPQQLQPPLRRIAANKQPMERLFGPNTHRHKVLRHVRRICKAAGSSSRRWGN